MAGCGILATACVLLACCMPCAADEVVFQPTAPIAHSRILNVYALLQKDGLVIGITLRPEKEKGAQDTLTYDDVSVAVVDSTSTRPVKVTGRGVLLTAGRMGYETASLVVRPEVKEIRAVLVRVRDLVVALTPSAEVENAAPKPIEPSEKPK